MCRKFDTPLIQWLKKSNTIQRLTVNALILIGLKLLEDGLFGDCKRLTGSKLSELRLDFGKGYRIYFKELDNVIILIVAGGDKSDQKRTIKQADKYLEEYLTRSKNNDN